MSPTTTTLNPDIALCTQQQLCQHLHVPRDFVLAMRRAGFPMPGKRNTITAALTWLNDHPDFHPATALAPTRPSQAKKAKTTRKPSHKKRP